MKHIIVGTAGHVDHGKSTLIKALTGRETDNLAEEKERGISINLGFTYFDLPSKTRVGIVDVPGHERFIKNMLSGASGLDIVLLIIAADEGAMPQTVEHVDILSYLNIPKGIVVLTKCDDVDEEILELVEEDVREHLKNTFLKDAPIIEVDSITGRGLDHLVQVLDEMKDDVPAKNNEAPSRMNIDRVFTLKGIGTVVTGTLTEGSLNKEDEYFLYPQKIPIKIRSIQIHGEDKEKAYAGQRVALNIPGIPVSELKRGNIIAAKNSLEKTRMIDVKISLIDHSPYKVKHWDRLRLFIGSSEIFCRAVPLEDELLEPGESALFQLRLEEEIYCRKKDVFVLRSYSPIHTIGGGVIIDTSSKKHKYQDEEVIDSLLLKEKGELKDLILEFLREQSSTLPKVEDISAYTSEKEEKIQEELVPLTEEGTVTKISSIYFDTGYYNELGDGLKRILTGFHKHQPFKSGIKKEELRSRLNPLFKGKEYNSFLESFKDQGIEFSDTVRFSFHEDSLTEEQKKLKEAVLKRLEALEFKDLPSLSDFAKNQDEKDILEGELNKKVIALSDEKITHLNTYNKAKDIVRELAEEKGQFILADFRTATGSSRKISSFFLDYMDSQGYTKRIEDHRILL
ncbi:MAG: selenocysteine-specific translation elongation factor [Gallicola sp.]|nr:selenocysteine-specific translation elongation factor [Gallicola sp.]